MEDIDDDMLFFEIGLNPVKVFQVIVNLLEPAQVLHELMVPGTCPPRLLCKSEIFCCGLFLSGCWFFFSQHRDEREGCEIRKCFHDMADKVELEQVAHIAKEQSVH